MPVFGVVNQFLFFFAITTNKTRKIYQLLVVQAKINKKESEDWLRERQN
jgi:hypothetical protein